MARFSSLYYPPSAYFLRLPQFLVDAFGGDQCCAAIVSTMDFLTIGKIEEYEARHEKEGLLPWVQISLERLNRMICGLYSVRSIQGRLAFLVASGIIVQTEDDSIYGREHSKPLTFLLNKRAIDDLTVYSKHITFREVTAAELATKKAGAVVAIEPPEIAAEKFQRENVNLHDPCTTLARPLHDPSFFSAELGGESNKGKENKKENKNNTTPQTPLSEVQSSENQNAESKTEKQNPLARASQQLGHSHIGVGELYLSDPIEVFVKDAYSRERRVSFTITRKQDGALMESLHALEVDGGPEPVRAAFIRFLRDPDPWLVENGWPIRKFMKAWMLYDYSQDDVPDEVAALRETMNAGAETGQDSISTEGGATGIPLDAATGTPGPNPASLDLRWDMWIWYVDQWNELAPSAKVKVPAAYKNEKAFWEQKELAAIWPDICRRVEEHYQSDEDPSHWLTLDWILQEKNGVPNWRGFLARKPKRAKKARTAAEVLFGKKAVTTTK